MTDRLSVIMPVLDEARRLPARLTELARTPGVDEVVVVDGGSQDGSPALATAMEAALRAGGTALQVIAAARGRARQMNAGAAASTGDILLFQHADVQLPGDARPFVDRTLGTPGTVAGAFWTWHHDDREIPTWAPWLHVADVRSAVTTLPYGDQCLFLRREAFEAVGTFPDQPLMEDLELAIRLRRRGSIRTAAAAVRVSGRRFLRSPLRYALLMNTYPALYRLGISPQALVRWYENVR